jgi:Domain of unknown function (DUF4124)
MKIALLFATLALVAASAGASEKFYKWKDADGAVHYTSTPPPKGVETDKVAVSTKVPDAPPPPAADAQAKTAGSAAGGQAADVAAAKERRQKACDSARAQVAALESSPAVRMDADGDGTAEMLTAEQQGAQLTRARQIREMYCSAGPQ